jgi:hypothetical protein
MKNTKKLYLISLTSGMLFYTPVMTLFLLQRNISVGFLIAAQTMFSVAMMAGELPTGVLADKYGQKMSMKLGLLLDSFGMLQLLLIHNQAALLAYFAVRGISVAFRSGSDEALLYESHVAENKSAKGYSKAYGKFLSSDLLGFIIATAISGVAVQIFGADAYAPLIVATGIVVLLAYFITRSLTTGNKPKEHKKEFNSLTHLKQSIGLVKKNRTIFALMIAGLLTLNGEYFLRQSYQPYFEQMEVPAIFLGVALAAGKLLNYMVIRWSHVMEKYLTVDRIILWVNVLTGALFVLLALAHSPWALVPVFILIQSLLNAERPVVSDYVNQRVQSFQRSTVLSAVSFVQNLGQIGARLALAISIGLIGVGASYAVQGTYMIIGAIIGVWYLRRCGCVHKVTPTKEYAKDLELVEEVS